MTSPGTDLYTRCYDCGFIAPPEAAGYSVAADGGIDWARPVEATCLCCHAHGTISAADVLPLNSQATCGRCGATVACPDGAARVRCTGCGLFLLGPDLSEAQLAQLAITEGLAGLALRHTYLTAKNRTTARPGSGERA